MLTAFTAALTLITLGELGDKTFFISMILATRHSKRWVFLGGWGALTLMTLLSVALGKVFQLLPREFTFYTAIVLFTVFGLKMLIQGLRMGDAPCEDECEAAVETVEKAEARKPISAVGGVILLGQRLRRPLVSRSLRNGAIAPKLLRLPLLPLAMLWALPSLPLLAMAFVWRSLP